MEKLYVDPIPMELDDLASFNTIGAHGTNKPKSRPKRRKKAYDRS
jgi:hypothetical protein